MVCINLYELSPLRMDNRMRSIYSSEIGLTFQEDKPIRRQAREEGRIIVNIMTKINMLVRTSKHTNNSSSKIF